MLVQIFLWTPVYWSRGAVFQMFWREVAPSRDLPIAHFVSSLRHLFLAWRMRVFGSRLGLHQLGTAPRHLSQGCTLAHVTAAAGWWPQGETGFLLRSAAQTILLILEHLSLPRSGHLPSQPSWMAHTPMVSPTVPIVSSTLTSIISHQTHPAGSHQPLCVGLQQSAALPQSCRKEWPGLEN